ncbi:MAG: Bug family tripartite tricarboxylate transporter substrate binding protein, partial [Burkholderiales bacterium]
MKRIAASTLIAATALLPAAAAQAQKYPERPIRLIVPFSPGGTSDLLGRVVGQGLAEGLGTTVVVDNRGGAGGTLGAALGAKAPPDGSTLLVSHVGLAVNETLYSKKQYNALTDLAPISRLGETPGAVVVSN